MSILLKTTKEIPQSGSGRKLKYPFNGMVVKKFFRLPVTTEDEKKQFYSAVAAARGYARRQKPKWRFVSRVKNGVGSIYREK